MKTKLTMINLILLTAGFALRGILPTVLFVPCYLLLILLPQLILLWFESREVVEAYDAYKKAKEQEKIPSVCRKKKHYDPVLYIANRQTIFRRQRITPTRAVICGGQ